MNSFTKACIEAVKMIEDENTSLLVVGNTKSKCFPEELLPYTISREKRGDNKEKLKVNFLVNYGPEWDIENKASGEISEIELVIRWGGMRRLSGFLPKQTIYSDIYVSDVLWPDYNEVQIKEAIGWYQKQDVTKGG